jgi:hypothetical protein
MKDELRQLPSSSKLISSISAMPTSAALGVDLASTIIGLMHAAVVDRDEAPHRDLSGVGVDRRRRCRRRRGYVRFGGS